VAVEREREQAEDMKLRQLTTGPTKMTCREMMDTIGDNVEDIITLNEDDDDEVDDRIDNEDTELSDDDENKHK
jgi:hypothetical protein